jgi:hypothetical protein
VRVWTYMLAALSIFTRKPLKFNVTPKGHSSVPRSAYMPQLVLLVISAIAPIWATVAYTNGWIDYDADGWGSVAFWMNSGWALWNFSFAFWVVKHSLRMKQQRDDHRFAEQLAIEVRTGDAAAPVLVSAMTADLNPSGLGFRSTTRVEPGSPVAITLPLAAEPVETTGRVRHVIEERSHLGPVYMHGVEFDDLPVHVRDRIELYCTQHSMPLWRMKYRQSIDILTLATQVMRNLRGRKRRLAGLPAKVVVAPLSATPESRMLILEELSDGGARLVGDAPIEPGTRLTFDVPGAKISGGGTVRHVQALQTSIAVLFSMGVEFDSVPVARPRRSLFGRREPSREAVAQLEPSAVPIQKTIEGNAYVS